MDKQDISGNEIIYPHCSGQSLAWITPQAFNLSMEESLPDIVGHEWNPIHDVDGETKPLSPKAQ